MIGFIVLRITRITFTFRLISTPDVYVGHDVLYRIQLLVSLSARENEFFTLLHVSVQGDVNICDVYDGNRTLIPFLSLILQMEHSYIIRRARVT